MGGVVVGVQVGGGGRKSLESRVEGLLWVDVVVQSGGPLVGSLEIEMVSTFVLVSN